MLDQPHDWKALTREQRTDLVAPMAKQGLSSKQIAKQFSNVSRSAVVGHCSRNGIALGGGSAPAKAAQSQVHRKPHGNNGKPKAAAIVQRVAAKKAQAPRVEALPVEPIPEEDGVDVTHLIGIMDLNRNTCRYPYGDPQEAGFGFCGRPVKAESVYCPEHHDRCYGVRA